MPSDFIQFDRDCKSLEISTSSYLITILSKSERLSSPGVIEIYNRKIWELFNESGRTNTGLVNCIADFIGSNKHKKFEATVNPKKELEVIRVEDKLGETGHAYHLLPKSTYGQFSILEEVGLLQYKHARDPTFSAIDYVTGESGRNRKLMREEIDKSRIQWLNGRFYPGDHNCWIFKDLPSSLARRLGIDEGDVEKVQKDFLPAQYPPRIFLPAPAFG